MYINKVVFVEYGDVERLNTYNIIQHTDYDTTEIVGSEVQDKIQDLQDNPTEYDYNLEDFEEDMKDCLGTDLYEMLLNGEVDFCLVCP